MLLKIRYTRSIIRVGIKDCYCHIQSSKRRSSPYDDRPIRIRGLISMRRTLLIAVGVLAISAASFAQTAAGAAASRLVPRAGALSSIQGSAVTGSNGALKD